MPRRAGGRLQYSRMVMCVMHNFESDRNMRDGGRGRWRWRIPRWGTVCRAPVCRTKNNIWAWRLVAAGALLLIIFMPPDLWLPALGVALIVGAVCL